MAAGEQGELVGKIVPGDPMREFDGYVNADASKKKIGCNIFTKGDRYFLTGGVFCNLNILFNLCTVLLLRWLCDKTILLVPTKIIVGIHKNNTHQIACLRSSPPFKINLDL